MRYVDDLFKIKQLLRVAFEKMIDERSRLL